MFVCVGSNLVVDENVVDLITDLMGKVTGDGAAINRVGFDVGTLGKGVRSGFLNDGFLEVTILSENVITEVS